MNIANRLQAIGMFPLTLFVVLALAGCSGSDAPAADQPAATAAMTQHTHEVAGETCFICDAAKRDSDRLWCKEHGRYEDRCFLCHPEIEDKERLYCTEHFLYEDECFLCHPELLDSADAGAGESQEIELAASTPPDTILASVEPGLVQATRELPEPLYCNEHQVYENECGICHPELVANLSVGEGLKVRLRSSESAAKAGVRVGRPAQSAHVNGVQALGELSYNENELAVVTPLADGVVREVFVDVGSQVEKGQLLAEVTSGTVADEKSALVHAVVQLERARKAYGREQSLRDSRISAEQDLEVAHADFDSATSELHRARQQLLNLGLTQTEVDEVEKTRSTSSVLPLRAPFAGTVVERNAVQGTAVQTGMPLFEVVNLNDMWMELSVPETAAVQLRQGARVEIAFDALPGETFAGELTWIGAGIDEATRTVHARALVPNPDGHLKDGLYGRASIKDAAPPAGLAVPLDAVQLVDGRSVVFAMIQKDLYETRIVRTGNVVGNQRIILDGLSEADEIAVAESYILKSELLKARLGAGCTHD